ncbi:MAG: HTTM domain-containing protein [Planctomycetes bacterium]|nr:HTTM domain-containing protein [Planctomycetota bacterium]
MELVTEYLRRLTRESLAGWNRFWFGPSDPATLGMIRILAGAMLLYTHLVWTINLTDFFGPNAWISQSVAARQFDGTYAWSYFWLIESPTALWIAHGLALGVFACLMLGLFSRGASIAAFVCAVSYVNRTPGALFGLDQINCMLAMYLMLGPTGDAYSLDRWLAARRAGVPSLPRANPSSGATLAVRLIQIHMCVIYFFAGLSKMQGESWWIGDALWGAVANLEYQSLDMTWLCNWPLTLAVMTQTTVYWELFFAAIIWPRLTRPVVLFIAIPLHLGIGVCMGMMTFGLVMLIGCSSFISPAVVRYVLDGEDAKPNGVGEGSGNKAGRTVPRRKGNSPRALA